MFQYDLLTFFTFIVGRHIAPSAVSCRPKLVFGVFIQNLSNFPICSCTVVAFCRCLRFVPCSAGEAGEQSTAIQGSWRLCIAAYLHIPKQLHQDLFFSVCPTIFLFWTSAATAAVAVLLQLRARQIRMGSYWRWVNFLRSLQLRAIERRHSILRLRVVREIRRAHSWILLLWTCLEKNGKQINNLSYPDKKKCEWNEGET